MEQRKRLSGQQQSGSVPGLWTGLTGCSLCDKDTLSSSLSLESKFDNISGCIHQGVQVIETRRPHRLQQYPQEPATKALV